MPVQAERIDRYCGFGVELWKYAGLGGVDAGVPIFVGKHNDVSVQPLSEDFGGATMRFEGTLDERGDPSDPDHAGAIWSDVQDAAGATFAITSNDTGVMQLLPGYMWLRPKTTGGTGSIIGCNIKLATRAG